MIGRSNAVATPAERGADLEHPRRATDGGEERPPVLCPACGLSGAPFETGEKGKIECPRCGHGWDPTDGRTA
jgi:uncharacterized Zn-finger protein